MNGYELEGDDSTTIVLGSVFGVAVSEGEGSALESVVGLAPSALVVLGKSRGMGTSSTAASRSATRRGCLAPESRLRRAGLGSCKR